MVTVPDVTDTIESPDVWNQLRRELEDVGISSAVMEENHAYISGWLKSALGQGVSELSPDDPDARRPSDSGYGGSIITRSVASMSAANEEFEAELHRKRPDIPMEDVFRSVTVESTTSSIKKSRTDPTRLIRKLFQKETAIVQAASDGDFEKVVKLISIGCNVNTKDRWG